MYADIGAKGDGTEFHLNFTGAANYVGVTAAAPVQLLDLGWSQHLHLAADDQEPDGDDLAQRHRSKVTPTLALLGRRLLPLVQAVARRRQHLRGRGLRPPIPTVLCLEGEDDEQLFGIGPGVNADGSIPSDIADPLGSLDQTSQTANSFGFAGQAREQGLASFGLQEPVPDRRQLRPRQRRLRRHSELGSFGRKFVVNSLDVLLDRPRRGRRRAI